MAGDAGALRRERRAGILNGTTALETPERGVARACTRIPRRENRRPRRIARLRTAAAASLSQPRLAIHVLSESEAHPKAMR